MAAQLNATMSVEEYLEFERASETKHEYYGGEVLAMAGASYDHNTIVGNVFASLRAQLRGKPCRVNFSDIRVQIPDSEHFVRQANDLWLFSEAVGLDTTLPLPTIECVLALAEVYQEVELPE